MACTFYLCGMVLLGTKYLLGIKNPVRVYGTLMHHVCALYVPGMFKVAPGTHTSWAVPGMCQISGMF